MIGLTFSQTSLTVTVLLAVGSAGPEISESIARGIFFISHYESVQNNRHFGTLYVN